MKKRELVIVDHKTPKGALVTGLMFLSVKLKKKDVKEKKEIQEAIDYLLNKVKSISYNRAEKQEGGIQYSLGFYDNVEIDEEENKKIILSSPVRFVVNEILKGIAPKPTVIERLHKQPRNLLKTVAQRIGNTTETLGVFTLPETLGASENIVKDELSKNTGALALYLMQLYQQNNNKDLEIVNLAPLSEKLNCNNHRLKLFLLYLGGYTYPIVDKDEKTKELILTNEQLFKIEFRYNQAVADKYEVKGGEIQGVERVGNSLVNFIKDEPISKVIIKPSERFIRALEGKGLGNILTVNDTFVSLILELTDIATKILTYSSSNRPSQKIVEDNLIKHLGLTKQIKKQGKPRVRATILKGLKELMDKGHIKNYNYEDSTAIYSFTYSDKYVKFKENKRKKKEPLQGVQ
jgi:hypothetical protein